MNKSNKQSLATLSESGLKKYGGANFQEIKSVKLVLDSNVQYVAQGRFGAELLITNDDKTQSHIRIAEGTPMKEEFTVKVLKATRDWEEKGVKAGDIMIIAE